MYALVEATPTGLRNVGEINPPPGQQNLKCDDCEQLIDHGGTIFRVPMRDSTGLYPTGEKYVCRECNGQKSGAV